jgi:aminoglycoside phosphotransferase family enzyme/predicted kinase
MTGDSGADRADPEEAADAQSEVVRALADPAFHPDRPASVDHLQTHISHVFLAGPYVYKLKKPVHFPFLDAGTPERRRALCEDECRLNRRLAAPVYLDVLPIAREVDGRLAFDGNGPAVEHVVWMRRLPVERMLDRLVEDGTANAETLGRLAALLAEFHAAAPSGPTVAAHASPAALHGIWADVLALAAPLVGGTLSPAIHRILADFGPSFIDGHASLLAERLETRRIREGHGDLRAEHVCILDRPLPPTQHHGPLAPGSYVIDCVEFSHALRCADVASDVAFLAMDLERLGRPDLAAAFVDAYVASSGDHELRRLLAFYCAYRACVRGAVEGLRAAESGVEAGARASRYFTLALRHAWRSRPPFVIACGGLSGSGKTTLAAALADATGFVHVSTDLVRRRDTPGTGPTAYGVERYTPAARAAVYARLCEEAGAALAAGEGVVADATFIRRADRDLLAMTAAAHGRRLLFLECDAAPEVIRRRLDARQGGPSEARWDTYLQQRAERERLGPDEPHRTIDTGGEPGDALETVLPIVWDWSRPRPTSPDSHSRSE